MRLVINTKAFIARLSLNGAYVELIKKKVIKKMRNFFNRLMYGKSNKQDLTKQDIESKTKGQLFFEILGVKYWELIKLNLILVVFFIPTILWSYVNFPIFFGEGVVSEGLGLYRIVYFLGLIPCLLIAAPALGGASYIIRNFTQDRHAWLWSDFWQRTKENLKQSVVYMLIYSIFLVLGQATVVAYSAIDGGMMLFFARTLFVVIYVLIILSIMYVYPMIVTYDLKLKDIIRNSLLLTVGRLFGTLGVALVSLAPIIIIFLLSTINGLFLILLALYMVLFGITFAMYVAISYTTGVFEKYLTPSDDEDDEAEESEDESEEV